MSVHVMVNGLGKIGTEIAKAIASDDKYEFVRYSLVGPEITEKTGMIGDKEVRLIRPWERNIFDVLLKEAFSDENTEGRNSLILLDFTTPKVVNDNVRFYAERGLNFIIGTTGGNVEEIRDAVRASSVNAVIAPNLALPIVMLQAMWEFAAESFPDVMEEFIFAGTESHQSTKVDVSGTMLGFIQKFRRLGIDVSSKGIAPPIRSSDRQIELGVPEEYLSAHAYHDYRFVLPSEGDFDNYEAQIYFGHNVNGRNIYPRGAKKAIDFLYRKVSEGSRGISYSMVEVMKNK